MLAYQRTYEKILEDLRNDVYPVNSLLPPEPKLEEIYHVSRTTVRRAIAQLADEGPIARVISRSSCRPGRAP